MFEINKQKFGAFVLNSEKKRDTHRKNWHSGYSYPIRP